MYFYSKKLYHWKKGYSQNESTRYRKLMQPTRCSVNSGFLGNNDIDIESKLKFWQTGPECQ